MSALAELTRRFGTQVIPGHDPKSDPSCYVQLPPKNRALLGTRTENRHYKGATIASAAALALADIGDEREEGNT